MRQPFLSQCPVCDHREAERVAEYPQLLFGRCVGCGLVYKREQASDLERAYDDDYFAHGSSQYLKRWQHRVRKCKRQLLAALEYAGHARDVLDVGCSAGYLLQAGRELGLHAVGLDVSEFAVRQCQERGLEAVRGSLEELPFADGSFDVVTAKHTLEHMQAPVAVLGELRRVLRPGGVVFLVVPDADYWKRFLLPQRGTYFRPEGAGWQHHVYYADQHLARICVRAGLAPVKAGKAILRRRLLVGWRAPYELMRFAALWLWNNSARWLHWRREIQLIARRAA